MLLLDFFLCIDTAKPVSYTHLDVYKRQVVLRVVVAPAVIVLLRDLSGLQLGGLFTPGPEHFIQPGSVLIFAEIHLQGKLTVLLLSLIHI